MKKTKYLFLMIFSLLLVLIPSAINVQAQVIPFADLDLEITVPDQAICITRDTALDDEKWTQAGITDPTSERKNFDKMNVQALFFDPDTRTTIRLQTKRSTQSEDVFHLNSLSEKERKAFLDKMVSGGHDKSIQADIKEYPQTETPFFRLGLDMTKDNKHIIELTYGTIYNGSMVWYDLYKENATEAPDESFVQTLVAGTHFTNFQDKAKFEKEQRQATMNTRIAMIVICVLVIVWILLRRRKRAQKELLSKKKADSLAAFYQKRKENSESQISSPLHFLNRTEYTEALLRQFTIYDAIFRKIVITAGVLIIYVVLMGLVFRQEGFSITFILSVVFLVGICYSQGFRIDKIAQMRWKQYETLTTKIATYHFYEDYFTINGVQALSEYPYSQVTSVNVYKDHIYLYIGEQRAFFVNLSGFEAANSTDGKTSTSSDEFLAFIKSKTK